MPPVKKSHTNALNSPNTSFPMIKSREIPVKDISKYAMGWRMPNDKDYSINTLRTSIDKVN